MIAKTCQLSPLLLTSAMKFISAHFDELSSTNDEGLQWLKKATPDTGLIITADHQIKGRGQRSNNWDQRAALDLAYTLAIKWPLGRDSHPFDPIVFNKHIALCLLDLIQQILPEHQKIRIKWPNDLLIKSSTDSIWEKCAGILIENTWRGSRWDGVVVGLGINVNSSRIHEMGRTSLRDQGIPEVSLIELRQKLTKNIQQNLEQQIAPEAVELRFNENLLSRGKWKSFQFNNLAGLGRVEAVDAEGNLLLDWKQSEEEPSKLMVVSHSNELNWDWLQQQETKEARK